MTPQSILHTSWFFKGGRFIHPKWVSFMKDMHCTKILRKRKLLEFECENVLLGVDLERTKERLKEKETELVEFARKLTYYLIRRTLEFGGMAKQLIQNLFVDDFEIINEASVVESRITNKT